MESGSSNLLAERYFVTRPQKTPQPTLITEQAQIDDLCRHVRDEGVFAFDTEFVMEDRFESEVCLIQIAYRQETAIIDPFLDLNISSVWALACDAEVETVVHAGAEDLALCFQHTNQVPRNVFDVQIAAGLVSHDYPLSLQKLVKTKLRVNLRKSKTLTDWRKRPLSDSQIRYAADDVEYLVAVRDKLHAQLRSKRRLPWIKEEFAKLEDPTLYRRVEEEKLRRVKGSGTLDGRELAIVQRLLQWREQTARKLDRPARVVLKDHLLVEIGRHRFASPSEVRDLRGINLSLKNIKELCAVVRETLALSPDKWPAKPKTRRPDKPEEAALVSLVTAVIRSYCTEHQIAYGLAATKGAIQDLVHALSADQTGGPESPVLLKGWRGRTVGAIVKDVLAGRKSLRVSRNDGKYQLLCE